MPPDRARAMVDDVFWKALILIAAAAVLFAAAYRFARGASGPWSSACAARSRASSGSRRARAGSGGRTEAARLPDYKNAWNEAARGNAEDAILTGARREAFERPAAGTPIPWPGYLPRSGRGPRHRLRHRARRTLPRAARPRALGRGRQRRDDPARRRAARRASRTSTCARSATGSTSRRFPTAASTSSSRSSSCSTSRRKTPSSTCATRSACCVPAASS